MDSPAIHLRNANELVSCTHFEGIKLYKHKMDIFGFVLDVRQLVLLKIFVAQHTLLSETLLMKYEMMNSLKFPYFN